MLTKKDLYKNDNQMIFNIIRLQKYMLEKQLKEKKLKFNMIFESNWFLNIL